ncbi:MAG: hypothetical protein QOI83_1620 [Streptomycetaceae bacterium]|jgi:hypothetical protein|nr:hypothetical protein [Streptomycetaceae bacterium]
MTPTTHRPGQQDPVTAALTVAGVLLGRDADHAEDAEFTRSLARAGAQTVATQ